MKFDTPADARPIGRATNRIDATLKVTGAATYSYEHQGIRPAPAYGFIVGAAIAKGRIIGMDLRAAKAAPSVIAIVTAENAGKVGTGDFYVDRLLAGPDVDHYFGFGTSEIEFSDGYVHAANRRVPLSEAAQDGALVAEDEMTYGDLSKQFAQQTLGAHFVEVAVDAATGEIRTRRMLAGVCGGTHSQSQGSAQSGDRRDDHGRRRRAHGRPVETKQRKPIHPRKIHLKKIRK